MTEVKMTEDSVVYCNAGTFNIAENESYSVLSTAGSSNEKGKSSSKKWSFVAVSIAIGLLLGTTAACIAFALQVSQLKSEIASTALEVSELKSKVTSGQGAERIGGVSFTHWGRTTCPDTEGTEMLYSGTMAGSVFTEAGSAEYLCLHAEPEFDSTVPGLQNWQARLCGAEYRTPSAFVDPPAFADLYRHYAPCSVCYTPTRSTKVTIPARISCPASWTREYHGYYMTSARYTDHKSRVPVCIDEHAEASSAAQPIDSARLHFMETTCIGVGCPPYGNGTEITCTVCTK